MLLLTGMTYGAFIVLYFLLLMIPFVVVGILTFLVVVVRKSLNSTEQISYRKMYVRIFVILLSSITVFAGISYLLVLLQTALR